MSYPAGDLLTITRHVQRMPTEGAPPQDPRMAWHLVYVLLPLMSKRHPPMRAPWVTSIYYTYSHGEIYRMGVRA